MSVIVLLIAAGGIVAGGFLAAFVWAVRSGQFDDTTTPAVRVLLDPRRPDQRPASSDVEARASTDEVRPGRDDQCQRRGQIR
jgi:cbb3-type cytochrome oxidase maturation protein